MNQLIVIRSNSSDYNDKKITNYLEEDGIKCHYINFIDLKPIQRKKLLKCVLTRSYDPIHYLIKRTYPDFIEETKDMRVDEVITELAYRPEALRTPIMFNQRRGVTIGKQKDYEPIDYLRVA